MTSPIILPAATITAGQPWDYRLRITTVGTSNPREPVAISGWTGTVKIARRIGDDALVTMTPALSNDGFCAVALTADQTAELPASPRLGGRVAAVMQIELSGPSPEMPMVFHGALSIAGRVK